MLIERTCIVGTGLMGGSLAMALRPFIPHLTLVDHDPDTRAACATLADVVTDTFADGVREATLVILAVPARAIVGLLADLPAIRPDGCAVMDIGSTKSDICAAMADLPPQFDSIGGHPMCGKEISGFAAADADLYRGQTFVLCEHGGTTAVLQQTAVQLIHHIGANPIHLAPDTHDNLVAAISHLPYLASATLMRTAAAMEDERAWTVSASGFRDTSRIAGSDPQMMLDILMTNKTAVLTQLAHFQEMLTAVTTHLQNDDEAALRDWLTRAQSEHRHYKKLKMGSGSGDQGSTGIHPDPQPPTPDPRL